MPEIGCRLRSTPASTWRVPQAPPGAFPRPLYDAFVEYKTDEWERFCSTVTEWHREMYLRALP